MQPINRTGDMIRWSEESDNDCVSALLFLYHCHTQPDQFQSKDPRITGFKNTDALFMCAIAERINNNVPITERQLSVMKYKLNSYGKQLRDFDPEEYFIPWKLVRFEQDIKIEAWKRCTMLDENTLKLEFSYDTSLITRIKSLSGRKFHNINGERYWSVPASKLNIRQVMNLGFDLPDELQDQITTAIKQYDYSGLKMQLRPYQIAGADRIAGELRMSGLLADEMGLGKSAQALAALWAKRETAFPALVICPGSLKYNWAREAEMWLPNVSVRILNGLPTRTKYTTRKEYELTVINYDILADRGMPNTPNFHTGWGNLLAKTGFKTVIFDECHKMKNPKAKRTASIMQMCRNIPNRIALSGTPIESRPIEFFTTLQLVAPKLFPNYWQFGVRYGGMVTDNFGTRFNGASNTKELNDILTANCMVRRRKADVLTELPPKQRQVIPVEIDMKEYKEAEASLVSYLQKTNGVNVTGQDKLGVLSQIETCKQAATLGKMKQAIEFIENYLESGKKLVVFATHTFTLDMLQKAFGKQVARVDGGVTGKKRQAEVDRFQNDENCRLFIGNIKAAGVGLTLTAASDTLTLELGWTPGEHEQAEDRVHRIGQEADSVMAYYIIAQGTIEQKIMQILDEKRETLSQVLDGMEAQQNGMLTILLDQYLQQKKEYKSLRRSKPKGVRKCQTC